ncbi:MAG: transcription elongation factor GreA, partial [Actinobacteria bacterium]|nr:transcription elongation factor GreA [Actinomycetota bacterium]
YHAAREEQGKLEGRIRQLKHMLEHAHVGVNPDAESGVVSRGSVVTIDMGGDEMKFLLGSRESAPEGLDVYSDQSPLGAAVLGAKVGSTVEYSSPDGKRTFKVAILECEPYTG